MLGTRKTGGRGWIQSSVGLTCILFPKRQWKDFLHINSGDIRLYYRPSTQCWISLTTSGRFLLKRDTDILLSWYNTKLELKRDGFHFWSCCCSEGWPEESHFTSQSMTFTLGPFVYCQFPCTAFPHLPRRGVIKKLGIIIKTMFTDYLKLFIPGIPCGLKKKHFAKNEQPVKIHHGCFAVWHHSSYVMMN